MLLFSVEWHCECFNPWPWLKFSRSKIWTVNIIEMVKASAKVCQVVYRFWHLASIGTFVVDVFHHFDLNFQGQTFSCYAFAIQIVQWQRMSPTDFRRLARPLRVSKIKIHMAPAKTGNRSGLMYSRARNTRPGIEIGVVGLSSMDVESVGFKMRAKRGLRKWKWLAGTMAAAITYTGATSIKFIDGWSSSIFTL